MFYLGCLDYIYILTSAMLNLETNNKVKETKISSKTNYTFKKDEALIAFYTYILHLHMSNRSK